MKRRHLLGQRRLRRVDAPDEEREFLRVAVNMRVAIACSERHVEAHRRRGLRRLRKSRSGLHGNSGRDGSRHECASRWFLPAEAASSRKWRSGGASPRVGGQPITRNETAEPPAPSFRATPLPVMAEPLPSPGCRPADRGKLSRPDRRTLAEACAHARHERYRHAQGARRRPARAA